MLHRTLLQQRIVNDISQTAGMRDTDKGGTENVEWLPTMGIQQLAQ